MVQGTPQTSAWTCPLLMCIDKACACIVVLLHCPSVQLRSFPVISWQTQALDKSMHMAKATSQLPHYHQLSWLCLTAALRHTSRLSVYFSSHWTKAEIHIATRGCTAMHCPSACKACQLCCIPLLCRLHHTHSCDAFLSFAGGIILCTSKEQ